MSSSRLIHARCLLAAALLGGFTPTVRSGAIRLNTAGARSRGMAGAYVAVADDPAAGHHNPAGQALVSGRQLLLGTNGRYDGRIHTLGVSVTYDF